MNSSFPIATPVDLDHDLPDIDLANGYKAWHNNKGEFHRTNGPAVITTDGSKEWFINGVLHREDGPALDYTSGKREWYQNGKPHRIGGPAIIHSNGTKQWCQHGKLHREDGPAIEYLDGTQFWYLHGKHHRVGGPAVEYSDGYKEFHLFGEEYYNEKVYWAASNMLKALFPKGDPMRVKEEIGLGVGSNPATLTNY